MKLGEVLAEDRDWEDEGPIHGENVFELTTLDEVPDDEILRHIIRERGLGITFNYKVLTNITLHVEDEWKRRAESYAPAKELDMHVMTIGNTVEEADGYYHPGTKALTFIGKWKIVLAKNGVSTFGTSADRQVEFKRYGAIVTGGAKGYVHIQVVSPEHVEKKWKTDTDKLDLDGLLDDELS